MSRTVYINGSYLPEEQATVSIFDRGFLMADAIYEVTAVLDGKLIDYAGHMRRLNRSLAELRMSNPLSEQQWLDLHRKLLQSNQVQNGLVYLQVTRGNPGDRDFKFPATTTPPTVVAFTQSKPDLIDPPAASSGWKVLTIPDLRWGRRDIKTTQLLYPSMGKMMAVGAGVDDAWFVEDGYVTEGTSNNAYILQGDCLITRQLGNEILHGITRAAVVQFATQFELQLCERPFSVAEALAADEAFVTSASAFVMPVVQIDGHSIGTGNPGQFTLKLRQFYIQRMQAESI
ncbi:MAG: D-amino-acid transaminase [Pirellulales bacterium]